jgi:hypothetical protein
MWIYVRRCDNCGKINPPIFNGNKRLCAACAEPNGLYRNSDNSLGANGKIYRAYLRFPFKWRGWFSGI